MFRVVFHLNLSPEALTLPPPLLPTTIGGHHEPPLLAVGPLHEEEHFNQSEILRFYLKDLVENKLPILSFVVFLR